MKKYLLAVVVALSGCEAVPYVFNAAGFVTTQYIQSKRQDEMMAKLGGYDRVLAAICEKLEIDTGAINFPPAENDAPIENPIEWGALGVAGAALARLVWIGAKSYAKSKGVDIPEGKA